MKQKSRPERGCRQNCPPYKTDESSQLSSYGFRGPCGLQAMSTFDDQSEQVIDFRAILGGELYGPLRDLGLFNQVRKFGRTERTSIRRPYTIGRKTKRRSLKTFDVGSVTQ
jgi:hypothetical protein